MDLDYYYIKIHFGGVVKYVKIKKHETTWSYKDFLLTASMYANISVFEIDYFADAKGVQIPEEAFLEIFNQYKHCSNFELKIVLKTENNVKDLEHALSATQVTRQNCRLGSQMHINSQDLESFLKTTQNSYILCKKNKTKESIIGLSDVERRSIIRESVDFLVSKFTYHPDPEHITALALAIIELFPQLKTKDIENGGIDALYDRKRNRGYLIARLNRIRQKLYAVEQESGQSTSRKRNVGGSVILSTPETSHDLNADENFLILKNLNVETQKNLIKQKLLETLALRVNIFQPSNEIKKISNYFPFFFTSPDLILYDFQIRYPANHQTFLNKWKISSPSIKKVFVETKGPNYKRIPEIEELLPSMQDLFYLLNILPQVIAGKSSTNIQREPFANLIRKILVFRTLNLPPAELLEKELRHPYIIAEGENKSAISNYFLAIEEELIVLPNNLTFIEAIDLLFKSHYVFGQHFDGSLKTFWTFICHYFYEIEATGTITTRIKEIASKLDLQEAQINQ